MPRSPSILPWGPGLPTPPLIHTFPGEFRFPSASPAVRYMASGPLWDHLGDAAKDPATRSRALELLHARINAVSQREGTFEVHSDMGFFSRSSTKGRLQLLPPRDSRKPCIGGTCRCPQCLDDGITVDWRALSGWGGGLLGRPCLVRLTGLALGIVRMPKRDAGAAPSWEANASQQASMSNSMGSDVGWRRGFRLR